MKYRRCTLSESTGFTGDLVPLLNASGEPEKTSVLHYLLRYFSIYLISFMTTECVCTSLVLKVPSGLILAFFN